MQTNMMQELYRRYADAMEPWQLKLALSRLERLAVPRDDWEDVMQEMAVVICSFRFDPKKAGKASERTILYRRLNRRVRHLLRTSERWMGLRERVGRMASSEEDSATPVGAAETSELRRFIAGLPADEQAVCELLMQGLSVREIARQIRRRWLTIEHKVDRIRQRLLLAGFDSRLDA